MKKKNVKTIFGWLGSSGHLGEGLHFGGLWVAKTCKNSVGKKGVCLVMFTNFGEDMTDK